MRAFANRRNQVRVLDRKTGRSFTTHTANVFAERDYYTIASVDAEDDPELIEGLYSEVDSHTAPVHERLLADDFPLDGQARADFAAFMALQVARGPEHERTVSEATRLLGQKVLQALAHASSDYWARKRAAWEKNPTGPEPPPAPAPDQLRMLQEGCRFDLVPSREHVVETRFLSVEETTFAFMAMTWRLLRFDAPCLFSSEHPISYWRSHHNGCSPVGIGPMTADEIRFPLSPTRALVLTPPEPGRKMFDRSQNEGACDPTTTAARVLNWGTLTSPPSQRLLLSPDVQHHPLPVIGVPTQGIV